MFYCSTNKTGPFFLKFFFFNCEQFLLNTFLPKMIIYPTKMCFLPKKVCFLYFSCSPHSSTRPNCLYNLCSKSGQKLTKSLTLHKSAHYFFPGKNRIRKIREKSGYEIPGIFGQILLFEHTLECYMNQRKIFFVIFNNFDVFKIAIFQPTNITMNKYV